MGEPLFRIVGVQFKICIDGHFKIHYASDKPAIQLLIRFVQPV